MCSPASMLYLLELPRELQERELKRWTVKEIRDALTRQGIKAGSNTRTIVTEKMMVRNDAGSAQCMRRKHDKHKCEIWQTPKCMHADM
jgi:hypothetical protein